MGNKHCWNLHRSTFILFFHCSEINWIGKLSYYSDVKCYDSFLTYRLPMASILVTIGRIHSKQFKCNYLNTHTFFVKILLRLWNLYKTWHILKKHELHSLNIFQIIDSEIPGSFSEHPLAISLLTGTTHCWNLHGNTFMLFFHQYEINLVGKLLY